MFTCYTFCWSDFGSEARLGWEGTCLARTAPSRPSYKDGVAIERRKGHIASQCPNKRTMMLREDEKVDSESSCEDSSSSNEGDSSSEGSHYEGDLLIVRRLMSTLVVEETEN
ncbi:hypothetical protein CR513_49561, partial [Mucuna pruriens]